MGLQVDYIYSMIYIDDYTCAIDFLTDAACSKARFTYTDLLFITDAPDTIEVSERLDELVSLYDYKKFPELGETVYSNCTTTTHDYSCDIKDLEVMSRAWKNGLIDLGDPQEKTHYEALKQHIEGLKNDTRK